MENKKLRFLPEYKNINNNYFNKINFKKYVSKLSLIDILINMDNLNKEELIILYKEIKEKYKVIIRKEKLKKLNENKF